MEKKDYNVDGCDIAWCPGCGNFNILNILKQTLVELDLDPKNIVMVSGIGQAAKIPHYIKANVFNGLHGRALPPATGIKVSNPELTVIAESGDGDMYGEGGNHFIHTIRRNPNIVNIVHNNMVYGLTKGQASPTTATGFKTPVQVNGVILEPFNPLSVAISLDASFVARAYSGDARQTIEILKQAISHEGYALVDLLHPCVSFNKINTYQWYKENTYYLDESYDSTNRNNAFDIATRQGKLALGVIYKNEMKLSFEKHQPIYVSDNVPLYARKKNRSENIEAIMNNKR